MEPQLQKYIDESVDLKRLIRKMKFTEEEVEDAARHQPSLLLEASRYYVQKMRQKFAAKYEYDNAMAKECIRLREKKGDSGRKAFTEGAIKDRAGQRSKIKKLRKRMELAFAEEKFAELLLRAIQSRKDAIKVIIDARFAETGGVLKKAKEESGRKMAKKIHEEIKRRYKHRHHSSSFSGESDFSDSRSDSNDDD